MWIRPACVALAVFTAACGRLEYQPPAPEPAPNNVVEVPEPRSQVWNRLIAGVGKGYFAINNMDRSSGFLNLDWSGNTERYLDCGQISSHVSNARGKRSYVFPAAKANQVYEIMSYGRLFFVDRSMSADGRLNVILEEIAARKTRVTVNAQYTVRRTTKAQPAEGGESQSNESSIKLVSGGSASFPAVDGSSAVTCKATGELENSILSLVRQRSDSTD